MHYITERLHDAQMKYTHSG